MASVNSCDTSAVSMYYELFVCFIFVDVGHPLNLPDLKADTVFSYIFPAWSWWQSPASLLARCHIFASSPTSLRPIKECWCKSVCCLVEVNLSSLTC